MITPSRGAGVGQVFSVMANYRTGSNTRWIPNQSDDIVPITALGMTFLFNTMNKKEVKDWYGNMDPRELLELCYYVTSQLDGFVAGMMTASLEYNTLVAIVEDPPRDIELTAFRRVIQRFSEDIKDIKKWDTGGPRLNPALLFALASSCKIKKTSHTYAK